MSKGVFRSGIGGVCPDVCYAYIDTKGDNTVPASDRWKALVKDMSEGLLQVC